MARARSRYCCKRLWTATAFGNPAGCGRQDVVFVGPPPTSTSDATTTDVALEFAFAVLTNAALLVPVRMLWRRRKRADVACGAAVTATSTLYHACDALDARLLGLTAGNWHRLDNVFLIFSAVGLALLAAGPTVPEDVRWVFVVMAVVLQEANPWHVGFAVAPVAAADVFALAWALRHAPPSHRARLRSPAFAKAVVLHLVALAFFFRGCSSAEDPFRFFHSLWHLTNAAAAALFIHALLPLTVSFNDDDDDDDDAAAKKAA